LPEILNQNLWTSQEAERALFKDDIVGVQELKESSTLSEKIYVISCRQDLASFGIDRMRTSVEGLEARNLSLDWSKVKLEPVVAEEKVPFQEGETRIVPIKAIEIPAYAMVFHSFYGSNGMGHISCIGALEFKHYSEKRTANMTMFQSRLKASVMKGDLLGQVLVVPGKKA